MRSTTMARTRGTHRRVSSSGAAHVLAWVGLAARGVVIALVGVLVVDAVVTHSPAKSGGVDKALLTLRDQPFGPVLPIVVAIGLVVFGVYGLCEALAPGVRRV